MKDKNLQVFSILTGLLLVLFTSNLSISQWTFVGGVTGTNVYPSIGVADENTVFIFGGPNGQPKVYRSTNGGTNFTALGTTGLGNVEFYCGWGVNANLIFAGDGGAVGGAGGNATFYKTTNGGVSWTIVGSTGGTAGFFNGIVFARGPSPPYLFGVAESDPPLGAGTPYYLSITTNGGTTWTVTNPPGIPGGASGQNSVMVVDNQFYGFGLNSAPPRIYMTNNGGTSWSIGNLGILGTFVGGFAFSSDKQIGIASTSTALPSIARTTNGGTTWSIVNTNTGITSSQFSSCKWIPLTNVCYVAGGLGSGGVIAKSTDAGLTWTTMTTAAITGIAHMEFYTTYTTDGITTYGYAVAGDGSVIKLVDVLTGAGNNSGIIPTEYKLEQNFPNPFNPSTTIKFSIPTASHVTLKVYNALGKEIASILDDFRQAGEYSEGFAATSGLTSGIYFYKLTAGDFTDTKKMLMIK